MDEEKLKIKQKAYTILKILFSFLLILVGVAYLRFNYNTSKVFCALIVFLNSIQLLICIYTLAKSKYIKPFMWFDLIQGIVYSVLLTLFIITYFKVFVLVFKILFGVFILIKFVWRVVFLIRCVKNLSKSDLTTHEMNKLRKKILSFNVLRSVFLFAISVISYIYLYFTMV